MDGMQFGQWLHQRRRKCGFSSQRSLAERAQHDPLLASYGISEAFLARLETGQLAHPFRGRVRQRVLALASLLCKTPKEIQAYLRAAETTELDAAEQEQIARLYQSLTSDASKTMTLLPPRPARLFGRQEVLDQLVKKLRGMDNGVALITGMPGVGKSALAAETLHQLASDSDALVQAFSDGVLSISCAGYRGQSGLLALLEHLEALIGTDPGTSHPRRTAHQRQNAHWVDKPKSVVPSTKDAAEAAISSVISRVQQALAGRSLLILLDDLDPQFPLRHALTALLSQNHQTFRPAQEHRSRRVILATSRYQFSPATITYQLRLEPLAPLDALEYLAFLLDHPCDDETFQLAQQACASVGHLPLAIESLAACARAGIPLALLHAAVSGRDLLATLESEPELLACFNYALAGLTPEMRQRFGLLSLLGASSFSLEAATAMQRALAFQSGINERPLNLSSDSFYEPALQDLAHTALELGQFVRHSLLDWLPSDASPPLLANQPQLPYLSSEIVFQPTGTLTGETLVTTQARYQLHPVLRAYSQRQLEALPPEEMEQARSNLQAYSLAYLEQHRENIPALLRERDVLFAAFIQAVQTAAPDTIARFVDGMAPISCRLPRPEDGDWLFQWGIQACQRLHDLPQQARFMHSFAWLCCQRGQFAAARQAWEEALEVSRSLPTPNWQPLLGLAHLAHIQNEDGVAAHTVEVFLQQAQANALPLQLFSAKVRLAQYQRLHGDTEQAFTTLKEAQHLLATDIPLADISDATFPILLAQIELARLQGDYAATQQGTHGLAAYTRHIGEPYALAYSLLEQAHFATQQGQWNDVPELAQRIVLAAEEVHAAYVRQRGLHLAQQAEEKRRLALLPRQKIVASGELLQTPAR